AGNRECIVAGIAGQHVGQGVVGGIDVAGAVEGQVLDVGAQRVADGGVDGVSAFIGVLAQHVADIVDKVGVVAGPAGHRVGASAAIQNVVAGPTIEGVV